MATPINLASASPRVIKAWCKLIKVDCLNDLFKSNKIEAAKYADVIGSVSPCRDFTSYLSPSSVARSVISHYPAGFLDYSETEFRDQTGHVTHVNKKSKISPKHYSEWQRNRKP